MTIPAMMIEVNSPQPPHFARCSMFFASLQTWQTGKQQHIHVRSSYVRVLYSWLSLFSSYSHSLLCLVHLVRLWYVAVDVKVARCLGQSHGRPFKTLVHQHLAAQARAVYHEQYDTDPQVSIRSNPPAVSVSICANVRVRQSKRHVEHVFFVFARGLELLEDAVLQHHVARRARHGRFTGACTTHSHAQ